MSQMTLSHDKSMEKYRSTITQDRAIQRLKRLLQSIPNVKSKGHNSPSIENWDADVLLTISAFYGPDSLEANQFKRIDYSPGVYYPSQPDQEFVRAFERGLEQAGGFLSSRILELEEDTDSIANPPSKIFVVHGHDHGAKEAVARFLSKLGLLPIILHEQPDLGRTIIEKFEQHADVTNAVVILTADDIAHANSVPEVKEQRARQNVILEMGFFLGKLGRSHTFALVESGVATPSDFSGVLYIPMGPDASWHMLLIRELKAAGLNIDANHAF